MTKALSDQALPGGPAAKPCSPVLGPGFSPWSGSNERDPACHKLTPENKALNNLANNNDNNLIIPFLLSLG